MKKYFIKLKIFFLIGLLGPSGSVLAQLTAVPQQDIASSTQSVIRSRPLPLLDQRKKVNIKMQQEQIVSEEEIISLTESVLKSKGVSLKEIPELVDPSFRVTRINMKGNTLFSIEEFQIYIKKYEGRDIFLRDLQELASLITSYYQKHGYMTSRAYVPPQKITDGTVVIKVIEGKVGEISLKDNKVFSDTLYWNRFAFASGQLFDVEQLIMSMQEINQLPDRSVKAYLEPGKEQGSSDITIVAQEKNPYHASYEYNTRGSRLTHVSRHILHLTHNNLTGHGDTLQSHMSLAQQKALLGWSFQYALPSPEQKIIYSLDAGYAYSRIGKEFRPLKVTGQSFFIIPGLTKNFIKNPQFKADGFIGLEIKDSKTLVGTNKLSFDRSRVLDLGSRLMFQDPKGRTYVNTDLKLGIPGLLGGSEFHSPLASRVNSGGQFAYLTTNVDRVNDFILGSYLVLHAGGQYSPTPLSALEQFYLGGMYSVRGYPENDSSGDMGVNFSTELRVPSFFIPSDWKVWAHKDKTWREMLSLITFIDGGRTFNHKRQTEGSLKAKTLLGTGAGLRFYLSQDMNIQAGIGFPFGNDSSDQEDSQTYLSARIGF